MVKATLEIFQEYPHGQSFTWTEPIDKRTTKCKWTSDALQRAKRDYLAEGDDRHLSICCRLRSSFALQNLQTHVAMASISGICLNRCANIRNSLTATRYAANDEGW